MKIQFTFDESAKDFVLEAFGKITDEEGYIVEQANRAQRVLTRDGEQIRKANFAGVIKGSERYIKSDLVSLIDLCDDLHKGN